MSGQAVLVRDVLWHWNGRAHLHGGVLVRWLGNWQTGHHAAQASGEAPCEAVRLMIRDSGTVAAMLRGLRNAKGRLAALAVGLGAAQPLIRHGRSNTAAKAQRQALRSELANVRDVRGCSSLCCVPCLHRHSMREVRVVRLCAAYVASNIVSSTLQSSQPNTPKTNKNLKKGLQHYLKLIRIATEFTTLRALIVTTLRGLACEPSVSTMSRQTALPI